jgi:hypothetical protein
MGTTATGFSLLTPTSSNVYCVLNFKLLKSYISSFDFVAIGPNTTFGLKALGSGSFGAAVSAPLAAAYQTG